MFRILISFHYISLFRVYLVYGRSHSPRTVPVLTLRKIIHNSRKNFNFIKANIKVMLNDITILKPRTLLVYRGFSYAAKG
jgi:hypothetical protein